MGRPEGHLIGYREAVEFLAGKGYTLSPRTLMNKVSLGIGPKVDYYGWNVSINQDDLLEWAEGYRWKYTKRSE